MQSTAAEESRPLARQANGSDGRPSSSAPADEPSISMTTRRPRHQQSLPMLSGRSVVRASLTARWEPSTLPGSAALPVQPFRLLDNSSRCSPAGAVVQWISGKRIR